MKKGKWLAAGTAAVLLCTGQMSANIPVQAQRTLLGYRGDLDYNHQVNLADVVLLSQVLLGNRSLEDANDAFVSDVNEDSRINGFDLALLRLIVMEGEAAWIGIYDEEDDPAETTTTEETTTITEETTTTTEETTTTTEETTTTTEETTTTTEETTTTETTQTTTETTAQQLSMADFPSEYQYAADWIWENRIQREQSTARRNTIYDQIVAGDGTINYVVRWQSYKTLTLEQRQKFAVLVDKSINDWNDWLKGYDGWKYDHINVNIVGWAVLDKSCLLDLQPDEVVWDNLLTDYDSQYDTSNGYEQIPDKLPSAPEELWRFNYFGEKNHQYPGTRFDMYLWCTQGWPDVGGCGGDWGQRLSDNAYIAMLDGTNLHVLEHEIGHGFGMTDFYGGEGQSDGFPPGGFPNAGADQGTSIMMAGSSSHITDFDGWMLRYIWSKIKDEDNRF